MTSQELIEQLLALPEQKRALSVVVNRVQELRKMVERISILMAVEMHSAASVPFDLAEVTTRVVGERRTDADQVGIELVAYLEPSLPPISGDPCQLEHVVESLVENALKFTLAGGRVEVDVYAEPGWICLAVTDTGIGIPEQELGRIFSSFYQADSSTTCKHGGIGLGLTLVKAVVEAHAGHVRVESQPGQGSRFLIRLPIVLELCADALQNGASQISMCNRVKSKDNVTEAESLGQKIMLPRTFVSFRQ